MLACVQSRYSWICKPAWCLPRLGGEAYSQKALTALGEPVQGLFRIAQSYQKLTLCLIFQTEGSKWCGLCSALGIVLVDYWLLGVEKERWRQRRRRTTHFTISAPGGFGRNSVRCRDFGWRSIPLEILIRDLEYRRRHSCESRDIFWSPAAKCESSAPTWVENRIIHHPSYSWYAAQISC